MNEYLNELCIKDKKEKYDKITNHSKNCCNCKYSKFYFETIYQQKYICLKNITEYNLVHGFSSCNKFKLKKGKN